MSPTIRDLVIVGGGTAGWMTAAALAKTLGGTCRIRLVESEEIGIIGVGEATIPIIRNYNAAMGIDEVEMLRETLGSFKLGIEFVNWGALGERYMHGFSKVGRDIGGTPFHHFWLRFAQQGLASPLSRYTIDTVAAPQGRFSLSRPDMAGSPLANIPSAYHFDASLYARWLRGRAEAAGVQRVEGRIVQVLQREPDGFVTGVVLEDGTRVEGEFFVDCSGLRALLIEQTLKTGFEDWSHWLPCDRAQAVPCKSVQPLLPYTRSTAHTAGWQWRIPLQHRIGNGHVYCSRFMDDDEARRILLSHLDGAPLAEPRVIRFTTGRRRQAWNRNVVAIGLSSGFLEPLESTSIHLIQTAIGRLVSMFPRAGIDAEDVDEFNRQAAFEMEHIRDFLILHYKLTRRDDSPFWRECAAMEIPASLARRMALFAANGRIHRDSTSEMFAESSWLQVMLGQGLMPRGHHPMADVPPHEVVRDFLRDTEEVVRRCAEAMPTHEAVLRQIGAMPA